MSYSRRIGSKQHGGTCWFHAILNGWILSDVGKVAIWNLVMRYRHSKRTKKPSVFMFGCPEKPDVDTIFDYIEKTLDIQPRTALGLGTSHRPDPQEHAIIAGFGIRSLKSEDDGGTYIDAEHIAHILFGKDYVNFERNPPWFIDSPIFSIRAYNLSLKHSSSKTMEYVLKSASSPYRISHAYLSFNLKDQRTQTVVQVHAICGFVSNETYMIYDSNKEEAFQVDWWNRPQDLGPFMTHNYPGLEVIYDPLNSVFFFVSNTKTFLDDAKYNRLEDRIKWGRTFDTISRLNSQGISSRLRNYPSLFPKAGNDYRINQVISEKAEHASESALEPFVKAAKTVGNVQHYISNPKKRKKTDSNDRSHKRKKAKKSRLRKRSSP